MDGCRNCKRYNPVTNTCSSLYRDALHHSNECSAYIRKDEEPIKDDPIKPKYYNDSKITPWDVIDDWDLGFNLGSAMKYIKRAGKKDGNSRLQDLKKIREYIDREIAKETR